MKKVFVPYQSPLQQKVTLYAFDTHGNPIEMNYVPQHLKARMVEALAQAHDNCPQCSSASKHQKK